MDPDDKPATETETPKDESARETRPEGHDECKSLITGLSERVEELENTMRTVISVKPDTSPVKGPWTHRKMK